MAEGESGAGASLERTDGVVTDSNSVSVESVQGLVELQASESAIDLTPLEFGHLSAEEIEFLDEQTKRTLDRHAEIQRTQRGQAVRALRATIAITGLLITLAPFLRSFLTDLTFASSIAGWRSVGAFVCVITASVLGQEIAADIYLIIETGVDVLSPEVTRRGIFGSLLTILTVIPPESHDEEAGATIRTVSILDELAPHVDDPSDDLKHLVIRNRLNRIRRNERVIDQNTGSLHDVHQRAKYALERGVAIFVLVVLTLLLLGTRI